MHDIGSLLKNIKQSKNELVLIQDCVKEATGMDIQEKEILFSTHRDIKKVSFKVSGAKKTVLLLNK